jgi:sec-independent protein translocase protein TatC
MILPVGFGLGFQLPLVMLFLERIGVFTVRSYLKQWRIAVLVIFVLAAILTPPDAYSMLLLAFSLTFLYFGGILLCKVLPRRSRPFSP